MLTPDSHHEVVPEKPVVGGRMLARVGSEVVLVAGAIPDERVVARVDRRQQGVWFATVIDVLEPSPDRRDAGPDPGCGGMTFAHIAYNRQRSLKAAMVVDAFARTARVALDSALNVAKSESVGYRTRYRVHQGSERLGFFREGTHEVCDVALSGQLMPASVACLGRMWERLCDLSASAVEAFECIENLPNTERAVNLAMRDDGPPSAALVAAVAGTEGVLGVSWTRPRPVRVTPLTGCPWVTDSLEALGMAALDTRVDSGEAAAICIRRHAPAFFQANRFLTPVLAGTVMGLVADGPVIDLYAGVGLFAVCLAATGRPDVTAIESDPISGRDLEENAVSLNGRLHVRRMTVESYLGGVRVPDDATLIVDPPRTGMSRAALQGILAARPVRVVYVSCDLATLARDTRKMLDGGYTLESVEGLDLFPNTAHVELVVTFQRRQSNF